MFKNTTPSMFNLGIPSLQIKTAKTAEMVNERYPGGNVAIALRGRASR
jgi:hypothetical protein